METIAYVLSGLGVIGIAFTNFKRKFQGKAQKYPQTGWYTNLKNAVYIVRAKLDKYIDLI